MKEIIKEKYSILIPIFLGIVLLIALFLYGREYKNNRYAYEEEVIVYQYFSTNKIEYTAKISRNRKKVILDINSDEFNVSLDSTPIYIKDSDSVIFPKEMSMFSPIKDKQYLLSAMTELYKENNLYYLNLKDINKSFDYIFLYDGRDLYFFIDSVKVIIEDREITLSPMSYVDCSYLNFITIYDKETDTYEVIELDNTMTTVLVENEYMTIDVASDKVIYKDDFTLLINDFSFLSKLVDNIN